MMDNLWIIAVIALAILLVIGIVLGVALTAAEKVFHVEEDPRIKDVEKMLPNANCGACGFAGCHDFAESIVKGESKKVSQCKAGKKEKNYDPIVAYMQEHPDKDGTLHVPGI